YYKADPSSKNTKIGESGLGLSIVKELVRLHHGSIEVTSRKNEGTTFLIQFPKEK
ncbi:TPA: ATP-binding protein, partial [Enterococcus faecium]